MNNTKKIIDANPVSTSSSEKRKIGFYERIYGFFGFQKAYNFPLFVIFGGAMLGFVFARLQYLDIVGNFAKNSAPGEWYWYRGGHYRIGITLHLSCCLPAGFLMVWQFVPAIRHKFLLFHRINGYMVLILLTLSNVGGLMIVRRSFGGSVSTQSAVGFLAILTTVSGAMGYINIKRLQIDQHRAWMLRTMFYCGVIITERIIMIIAALILSLVGSYWTTMTCDEVAYIERENSNRTYVQATYPTCFGGEGTALNSTSLMGQNRVAVHVDFFNGSMTGIAAAMRISFGATIWLALMLHAIGIELYLALTPREANRLRQVSYQKQLEAGMSKPGSAGLVLEKFGDSDEWVCKSGKQESHLTPVSA